MKVETRHEPACEFALHHGVVSAAIAHRLFYADITLDSVEREFRVLAQHGFLRVFTDNEKRRYYLPTERLCTQFKVHRSAARGRGAHFVAKRVGTTCFALRHGLTTMTAREFRERYPSLYDRKIPAGCYYIDVSREPHLLGWLQVDTGRNVRRLLQKVDHLFAQRFRVPAFARLIHGEQFVVVILTPAEGKKRLIEASLDKGVCGDRWVAVEVVAELQGILLKERSK